MTGFVILPVDHPPIAVEPAESGGVRVTVGNTSTTLDANEARQLAAAVKRARAEQPADGADRRGGA